MKKWHFTLALGVSYLALFHLWLVMKAPWIMASGTAASVALGFCGWGAWKQGYFVNGWDGLFHGAVILDIFLESWLIKFHEGLGFYWCAGAFGVVVAAYRLTVRGRIGAGGRMGLAKAAAVGAWLFTVSWTAQGQEPKDVVSTGIEKLKRTTNFTWTLTTTSAADDSAPQFLAFPMVRGKTVGEVTSASARGAGGDVEVIKKGEKKASKIRNQWKTPDEVRREWLGKSEADLKGASTNSETSAAAESEQINPVDPQTIFLGNDPTAVAGMIAPLPPIMVGSGRRAYARIPPPGANMARNGITNAPAAELPDAATLTEMLLEALPDPLEEAELILNKVTELKTAGAGYYIGEIPPGYVAELADARKRTGDNRPPQVKDARAEARFWISQGSLYRYQITLQATIIVGPTYNPLTYGVDRTTTFEFRGAGVTRMEVPPGAVKVLQ